MNDEIKFFDKRYTVNSNNQCTRKMVQQSRRIRVTKINNWVKKVLYVVSK